MFTEIVLTAITDAFIGSLVDSLMGQIGPAERLRKGLGLDPERIGFRQAFAKTYDAFAQKYPELVASFFDKDFLRGRAAPLVARYLTRTGNPDAIELADAWADQMGFHGEERKRHIATLMPAADFFLRQLESNLKDRDEFQALFDSRAFDAIVENTSAIVENTRQTARTLQNLQQATNAIFQTLAAASPSLQRSIIKFKDLVDERTKDFVGREFIFKEIDERLQKPAFPSGYIIIRGQPGIGKTSLMAQMVKERGYVHHFNIARQDTGHARQFLTNLCAQLIVRYQLNYAALPSPETLDSAFLLQLLDEAVAKAQGQQVVVLVDALDEVEDRDLSPKTNPLYLPPTLPKGAFFIVSTREKDDDHLDVDRRENIDLASNNPDNLRDIEQYIRNVLQDNHDQIATRIALWGVDEDTFVEILAEKSQGNFMYLHYMLPDIQSGRITAANLDSIRDLPQGLQGYYQRHWRAMQIQDSERFEKYYEPVVCTLAVTREPVSIEQIARWQKLDPKRVKEVIRVWREFLNESVSGHDGALYSIYHASFRDFLNAEVNLTSFDNAIAQSVLDKIQW